MLILVWIFTGVGIDVFFGQVGFAGWVPLRTAVL